MVAQRDLGSVPGSGRSPGEGDGNPLQYSCLENPVDRGAWYRLQAMQSQRVRHVIIKVHVIISLQLK